MNTSDFDIILVGGGLQNALVALSIAHYQPSLRIALLERDARFGGNHVWCFHAGDVPERALPFVEPLIARRWPGYRVHFPSSARQIDESYAATNSELLHRSVVELARRHSALTLFTDTTVSEVAPGAVQSSSGELRASLVIDARGPAEFPLSNIAGYQKFIGLELEVEPETVPALPTLMDARAEQRDGFRFFYVLPLSDTRVLVEDTYFSDSADLEPARLRAEILTHAQKLGLSVRGIAREERGVLPLPARCMPRRVQTPGLITAGYQGGWFHPTTGYSWPLALRFALAVAGGNLAEVDARVALLTRARDRQQRYATLLNRLLFEAFEPHERFHVFERFYRLPVSTLRRFYALDLSVLDRARILCGRPPQGFRASRWFAQHTRVPQASPPGENP